MTSVPLPLTFSIWENGGLGKESNLWESHGVGSGGVRNPGVLILHSLLPNSVLYPFTHCRIVHEWTEIYSLVPLLMGLRAFSFPHALTWLLPATLKWTHTDPVFICWKNPMLVSSCLLRGNPTSSGNPSPGSKDQLGILTSPVPLVPPRISPTQERQRALFKSTQLNI